MGGASVAITIILAILWLIVAVVMGIIVPLATLYYAHKAASSHQ